MTKLTFYLTAVIVLIALSMRQIPIKANEERQAPFFPGHNDIVTIAWNDTDTRLATGHVDGTVKIWNTTGQLIAALTGHVGTVGALAWNVTGDQLATAGEDTIIRIWDIPINGTIPSIPIKQLVGHTDIISALTWTADGKLLSGSESEEQNLRIWDVTAGNQIGSGNLSSITNFAWSPTRDYLAFGSVVGITGFINGTTLVPESTEYGQVASGDKGIQVLAWSPTGSQIAAGNLRGEILIWDRSTDSQITTLQANENNRIFYYTSSVFAIKYSTDGTKLMAVSADGTIRTWNTSDWSVLQTDQIGHGIYAADFSHDGSKIAYGKLGNAIQIISPAGLPALTPTPSPSITPDIPVDPSGNDIVGGAWNDTDMRLATGHDDGTVRICNTSTGQVIATLTGHACPVVALTSV